MKWGRLLGGLIGALGALSVAVGIGGRRLWVERLLSYYVGTGIRIEGLSLSWLGKGKWQAHLLGVQAASTEPTISFSPLQSQKVILTFEGLRLNHIKLEGASVFLVRQQARTHKTIRNYQRLFPKRGRGKPISIVVSAQNVIFYLFNQPAQVEIQAEVSQAEGSLEIDSVWLRLTSAEVQVQSLRVCYQGRSYEGLQRGFLHYTGQYRKAMDSWEFGKLQVEFPIFRLTYEGKIMQWKSLWGGMQVYVESVQLSRWMEVDAFIRVVMGKALQLSALWEGDKAYFHLWGEGKAGAYNVCGVREAKRLLGLEGELHQEPHYYFHAQSPDGKTWYVDGRGVYQGYPWRGYAWLDYATQVGEALFQFGDVKGRYQGSLWKGHGFLQRGDLIAAAAWESTRGLALKLDTLRWPEVSGLLEAYAPLWQNQKETRFPWQVSIAHLELDKDWAVERLHLSSVSRGIEGQGEVWYRPWDLHLRVEGFIDKEQASGWAQGQTLDNRLWAEAEWAGDSVEISASGLLEEAYYGQVRGWLSRSKRHFWVEAARLQSLSGSYIEVQGVFSDSIADGVAYGKVSLPEVVAWLPLKGVEIEEGSLTGSICFRESWQTLLSWDNQAEGWTRLSAVKGRFVKPDLPFRLSCVQVRFDPTITQVESLQAHIGNLRLEGEAQVQGTLGYIYEDWRALQGKAKLWVENFRLLDVWRIRRGKTYIPRLLLPEKMRLEAEIAAKNVDLLGFVFERVAVQGSLADRTLWLHKVEADYKGGRITAWGTLDATDTACYMAAWQAKAAHIPIQAALKEGGLMRVPAFQALGIQGYFGGELQAAIRFAPNLTWKRNSTFIAQGNISKGFFRTPPFFQWLRPFYVATYRDSMDFLAQVAGLSIVDGYLQLQKSLVVTRIAAFTIEGTHLLAQDRFLYRIQGTRVFRKAQRYPYLDRLSPYLLDRLTASLWLFYLEKEKGRTRWRYPFKLLLRRMIIG